MRPQHNRSWQLSLVIALSALSFACGDDSGSSDGDVPDLTGNNSDGDNNNGDNGGNSNGENNGAANNGGSDTGGNTANGGTATAGSNTPEDTCVKAPKTSSELLNACAPASVERRAFNNEERLPSNYEPGKLPAL